MLGNIGEPLEDGNLENLGEDTGSVQGDAEQVGIELVNIEQPVTRLSKSSTSMRVNHPDVRRFLCLYRALTNLFCREQEPHASGSGVTLDA